MVSTRLWWMLLLLPFPQRGRIIILTIIIIVTILIDVFLYYTYVMGNIWSWWLSDGPYEQSAYVGLSSLAPVLSVTLSLSSSSPQVDHEGHHGGDWHEVDQHGVQSCRWPSCQKYHQPRSRFNDLKYMIYSNSIKHQHILIYFELPKINISSICFV